jgi:ribosomal-protein-alanine N-acetyltransferase
VSDLETGRLRLRRLSHADADFILELLNDPAFLRYIGDKGVRDRAGACRYIESGPLASYERHGFGLLCVELRDVGRPIGICGLLKRETLDDVDVGFAFLAAYRSQGYASEAAAAVLAHGRDAFGLRRIVAICSPDNEASIRLLSRLGFRHERRIRLTPGEPEVELLALHLPEPPPPRG